MDTKTLFRRKVIPFILLAGFVFGGCVYDPYYLGPPPRASYHPDYYDYYYYPGVNVYFHFTTGFYFYFLDGRWVKSRVLPPRFHIDPHDRIKLRIESDRPYLKNDYYKKQYKTKPDFRYDRDRSLKEREANRKWYREYEQSQKKQKKYDEKDRKKGR